MYNSIILMILCICTKHAFMHYKWNLICVLTFDYLYDYIIHFQFIIVCFV